MNFLFKCKQFDMFIFLLPISGDLVSGVGPTPGPRPDISAQLRLGQMAVLDYHNGDWDIRARNWGGGIFIPEDIREMIRPLLRTAFEENGKQLLDGDVAALLLQGAWPGRSYARYYTFGGNPGTPLAPFHKIRVVAAFSEYIFPFPFTINDVH